MSPGDAQGAERPESSPSQPLGAEPESELPSSGNRSQDIPSMGGEGPVWLMSRPLWGQQHSSLGAFGGHREPTSCSTPDRALPRCWSQVSVLAPWHGGQPCHPWCRDRAEGHVMSVVGTPGSHQHRSAASLVWEQSGYPKRHRGLVDPPASHLCRMPLFPRGASQLVGLLPV